MSSTAAVESEVCALKKLLEKAMESDSAEADEADEASRDAVKALAAIAWTVELLRKTMIGKTVNLFQKKFSSTPVGVEAKALVDQWRNLAGKPAPQSADKNAGTASATKKKEVLKSPMAVDIPKPASSSSSSSSAGTPLSRASSVSSADEDVVEYQQSYESLPQARAKVVDIIKDCIKLTIDEKIAKFVALSIEDSINALYDSDDNKKEYMEKARSLAYNLKKNEVRDLLHRRLCSVVLV
jgi:TFIIS helical bundle-like domain